MTPTEWLNESTKRAHWRIRLMYLRAKRDGVEAHRARHALHYNVQNRWWEFQRRVFSAGLHARRRAADLPT